MIEWLDKIDTLLGRYAHIVSAIEAVSTLMAVIVSLALALVSQRANRTKLKAYASISCIFHSTIEDTSIPTYVTAEIRNVGILPLHIPLSFFHWKRPFTRGTWMVNPLDYTQMDEWVPQKKYPAEIRPRSSLTFFLSEISIFRESLGKELQSKSLIGRLKLRFLKPMVVTDDGKTFPVKIDRELRKELRALKAGRKASGDEAA